MNQKRDKSNSPRLVGLAVYIARLCIPEELSSTVVDYPSDFEVSTRSAVTMDNVKVLYFPLKAMAEGIRLILAYVGQDFEYVRISEEEWPTVKPNTPFGQVPVIEINGKRHAQTSSILRYLGKKNGLGGKTLEEDFEIDQVVDFFNDLRLSGYWNVLELNSCIVTNFVRAASLHYEKDEKKKAVLKEELYNNYFPEMFERLNDIITRNNGYMAVGKLTWADFMFAGMYDRMKVMLAMPDLDEKYPKFKKLEQTVLNLPKVKEYCANQPEYN
ncbi:unnamed protein product [Danaus chrysippus]|uniref:glutathione transferase n=1 Tax=Danaus chrysippus TaxID=151541 RepID=A0A8J2QSN9_9NEOP|nr:unnamed protein product [Danaus chrysippus]